MRVSAFSVSSLAWASAIASCAWSSSASASAPTRALSASTSTSSSAASACRVSSAETAAHSCASVSAELSLLVAMRSSVSCVLKASLARSELPRRDERALSAASARTSAARALCSCSRRAVAVAPPPLPGVLLLLLLRPELPIEGEGPELLSTLGEATLSARPPPDTPPPVRGAGASLAELRREAAAASLRSDPPLDKGAARAAER
mmetsp:Transcript_23750/g.60140  ORF Transcript_23750/g.60140 Transcript_23750/m.60140 type:complete len:206 (-) Transcript_23750:612-1229(-)